MSYMDTMNLADIGTVVIVLVSALMFVFARLYEAIRKRGGK